MNSKMICLLSLFFLGVSYGSPQGELVKKLFSDYDLSVHPGSPNSIGKVEFTANPLCMDLSLDGVLEGRVWIHMSWMDDRLVWNPEDHKGINQLRVPINKLWKPDIVPYIKKDITEIQEEFNAVVYSNGKVLYVPDTKLRLYCDNANLTDVWAVHECNIKYGSWTFDNNLMELVEIKHPVDVSEFVKFCPMKTLEVIKELKIKAYVCCPEHYASFDYTLKLQRKFLKTDAGLIYNPKLY
ncbi:neuronal acetylcholine receptor subunit alpha-6 [Lepeophtheirus salmonis]|uniref:neuronal acetylcholine receptor subunit alpha-6 n=1 Tax=Lepeophtheirus salmonis TaxID=72036 RepID=UPI001AE4E377|nr:neuronal acetylcholine receptor subunit alpha-6-like [Lepeophtheirus salmonis]